MTIVVRVPAVDDPDFVGELSYAGGAVLRLAGSADTQAAPALARALATVHDELVARRIHEIVVDLCALDSMIASCFTELVAWVSRLQELRPEDRYRIRLRSNPAIAWQQHSLAALSCFDTDLVTIEG